MRKKHPEHVNLERWLVSYADFITLLFAFFVVMYAISQADMTKFKKVAASMKAAFSPGGPAGGLEAGGSSGGNTIRPFQLPEVPGGRVLNMPAGKVNTAADADPQLQEMKELLEETISLEMGVSDVSDKLHMVFDSRGLVVRLDAKDFFEEGEVQIVQDLRPLLDRIGRVLSRSKRLIRIEGHIDTGEAKTQGYASGWEFSSARAAWVAKYLIQKFDLDPKRVGVSGYSYYRPVAEGKSQFAQAKNRRIEIIVLNNQYEEQ